MAMTRADRTGRPHAEGTAARQGVVHRWLVVNDANHRLLFSARTRKECKRYITGSKGEEAQHETQ